MKPLKYSTVLFNIFNWLLNTFWIGVTVFIVVGFSFAACFCVGAIIYESHGLILAGTILVAIGLVLLGLIGRLIRVLYKYYKTTSMRDYGWVPTFLVATAIIYIVTSIVVAQHFHWRCWWLYL